MVSQRHVNQWGDRLCGIVSMFIEHVTEMLAHDMHTTKSLLKAPRSVSFLYIRHVPA